MKNSRSFTVPRLAAALLTLAVKSVGVNAEKRSPESVLPLSSARGRELSGRFRAEPEIRRGYLTVALFVLLFFVWAGLMPLSSAAIAPGVVGVDGHKKSIQHLEGGIVGNIFVRDGDLVEQGQSLVQLSDVRFRADYQSLRIELIQGKAELLRWEAERTASLAVEVEKGALPGTAVTIDAASLLSKFPAEEQAKFSIDTQQEVLRTRLSVFADKLTSYKHQIEQAREEINGSKAKIRTLRRKKRLVDAELKEYEKLKADGMVTRQQLFKFREDLAEIRVDMDDARSSAAVAAKKISQLESQIAELKGSRVQESAENIDKLRDRIARLEQKFAAAANKLERVDITAPIAGYVVNSTVHTTGGVIAPGGVIMELIPTNEPLLVDARVEPKDRDTVRVGQAAEVRFNAFNQRSTIPIKGEVRIISADRVLDAVTKKPYYKTSIVLTEDPSEKLGGVNLHPGMQAEAVIITGDRTVLSYLLTPLTRSFNRALREE